MSKTCCVIGLGYVGLPTAILLANSGLKVLGVDIDEKVVKSVKNKSSHILEKDIEKNLNKAIESGLLNVSTEIQTSEIFIITVPTPIKETSGNLEPDISYVIKAAENISKVIKPNDLVILESTSPVGTTELIGKLISKNSNLDMSNLNFAYCPERVLPGNIFKELENNNRVIGGLTNKAAEICLEFYKYFCKGELSITNSKTAEMVKLSENTYRDVNIALANELSIICNELDININDVINISNRHPRVNILNPGCGVGGHCIAIDPYFIVSKTPQLAKLIKTARHVNENKKKWVVEEIIKSINNFINKNKRFPIIGCMGLSYKPNIDDLRESPSIFIIKELIEKGYKIKISEPNIKEYSEFNLSPVDELIQESEIIVLLVAHNQFLNLDFSNKLILDFCGLLK